MNTDTLKQVLADHARWLSFDGNGNRANLSGTYLSGANLSRANLSRANLSRADLGGTYLSGANLSRANLSRANLSRADLGGTYLSYADLSNANLSRADLSGADLSNANLSRADISRADLSNADLSGADLSNADLSGADLSDTCISPRLLQLARKFARECPPFRTGGRIVYRTACSQFVGSTVYEPGKTYIAPVLSWSVADECHPGIYAASLEWMRAEFPHKQLVCCYVRDGDWTITAKGAVRCSRIRVLEYVEMSDIDD